LTKNIQNPQLRKIPSLILETVNFLTKRVDFILLSYVVPKTRLPILGTHQIKNWGS